METLHGAWTRSSAELVTSKIGLKPYHMNGLQTTHQQLSAEAPVIELINPILRGWVNYFAVGHSSRCFSFVKDWVEKKIRRHLMRARKRKGFGWQRWSRQWLYTELGLYKDYRVRRSGALLKANPA